MRCLESRHRFRLVGYRDRRPKEIGQSDEDGYCLMDAIMACTQCSEVKEVGVTRMIPASVPQQQFRGATR